MKRITKAVKAIRKSEADQRQQAYDKLTTEQKIEKLDKIFGKGLGAKKQRTRLQEKQEEKKKK